MYLQVRYFADIGLISIEKREETLIIFILQQFGNGYNAEISSDVINDGLSLPIPCQIISQLKIFSP
jgi:hypothetical protein